MKLNTHCAIILEVHGVIWALKDLQLMPDLVSLNLEPLYDVIMSPCFHGNEMVFR